MKQKQQNEHILKWTATFILVFLLFAGCRKNGSVFSDTNLNYEELKSKFFNTTSTSDSEIKKLADDIKKQDSIFKFLPDFVRKNGLPKWDKVVYKTSSKSNLAKRQNSSISTNSVSSITNSSSSSYNDDGQGVFLIPLQSQNSQEIKSYITAIKHNDSVYSYRLYNRDSLSRINPRSGTAKNNLRNIQAVFGFFEKNINGIDSIEIKGPASSAKIKNVQLSFENPKGSNNVNLSADESNSSYLCLVYIDVFLVYEYSEATSYEPPTLISVSLVVDITLDCYELGDSGGGAFDDDGWWNYGTGWPWNPEDQFSDPDWYWWWTSNNGFSSQVNFLSKKLNLNSEQALWLEDNPQTTAEIYEFIYFKNYSHLSFFDKYYLANLYLNELMASDDFQDLKAAFAGASYFGHPWMIELFKEFATEIGLKVIKKYMPGYGDWQSIRNAIDNAGHGDLLGTLGEVLNIVKKKVPWLAAVDAVIDVFDFEELAKKAWKAFDKIKDLPTPAFSGLLKTIKDKCGDILGKIEHDNNIQGLIKYNPNDAENFFRDIANNVGVGVSSTSTPGVFYFDIGNPPSNIRFTYYPVSSSGGEPSISITFPGGSQYKFRFRL